MYKYHCLNPIARVGLDRFTPDYTKTNEVTEADGILVRSASMHEMELPDIFWRWRGQVRVSIIYRWRNARKRAS